MTSSSVHTRHQHAFILATLLFGLVLHVQGVTYELTPSRNKISPGQSLTISAKLIDPKKPVGDVRIFLAPPDKPPVTVFDTLVPGCRFVVKPYISTGTINQCDNTNHRYTITFPSVTADHVGRYGIGAPLQTPSEMHSKDRVPVQLLVKPKSVVVSPASTEVVASNKTSLTCTVDNLATIPVTFVWKRIQNGNKINPPSGSTVTTLNDRSNKLEWTSVGSQDGGQYECQATNEVGSATSAPATLVVYYAADSVTLTASATTVSAGTNVSVTCSSSGGNPRPGLIIYDVTSGDQLGELAQSSEAATLKYTKRTLRSDDGAKYVCRSRVEVGVGVIPVKTSNTITLTVQLKPTSVVVSPLSTVVVAGQSTSLTCTVDNNATIPVTFVWKRIQNGNRINPPSGSKATKLNDQRNNKLEWTSVGSQDGGQYECQATNDAGSATSTPATLVVYYAADSVTLTANATTVSAGTSVFVTCTSSGGNPRPGLVIYDVTSGGVLEELVQSSGAATLTYTKLTQKSDHGAKYACKTKVNVGVGAIPVKTSHTITLTVQFPPSGIITQPSTVDVDEGQTKSVRCQTTSSSNPETTLTWSGPAVGATTTTTVSEDYGIKSTIAMTLTGDRTRNGATYTCTATHLGQQVTTATTTMNVNFAPNGIAMYDTADTPILENQSRVMKCRSETSKPAGTITWRKLINGNPFVVSVETPRQVPGDHGGIVLESEITIIAARADNGVTYWCEVDYTYSNRTKVLRKTSTALNVYYPVDVSISISPGSDNIQEGDPVALTCDTSSGNPQTIDKYSWSYNGQIVQGAAGRILSLDPIRYHQGGNYSCSATNKGGTSSAQVSIDVKYIRLDPTVPHQSEIGVALGGSVTFTLTVLSNPSPSGVQWSRNGAALGQRFTPISDGLTYTLQVTGVVQQDYVEYKCRITNSVGSTDFPFILKAQGPPETPTEFRVIMINWTDTSLTFEWRSGFSGATNQTFLLEILEGVEDPEDPLSVETLSVEDLGNGLLVNYTVTDLKPGTKYSASVRSRNDIQLYSGYTPSVTYKTKASIDIQTFVIRRDGTDVEVTWSLSDEVQADYKNATVTVTYTAVDGSEQAGEKTTELSEGSLTFNVNESVEVYTYDITVVDGTWSLLRSGLKAKTDGGNVMPVVAGVLTVVILLILVVVIVVLVLLHRRGRLHGPCKQDKEAPEDDVEGTTNPGYLGSIDGKVNVSTPALSPYVEFPPELRPKRVSVVDKVKQRLSGVSNKGDETDSKYGKRAAGKTLIIENQHAEASFIENQRKPPGNKKKGFAFLKGKKKDSPKTNAVNFNSPSGESSTDNGQINPYGTTGGFANEEISPYGTTGGFTNDEINPYGTTELHPPGGGVPLYAEVNKPRNGSAPLYAEVNKPKKPPMPPIYAEVAKSKKPPAPPIYAEVAKSKKPPAPPLYAEVDKSKKSGFSVPETDAVIYAEVNLQSDGGSSQPEETYANLGSLPVRESEPVYANTSGVVPKREQPSTHVGVDGIIYTDLVIKPDPNKPKPKPKPKPEETIYAEIDTQKSKPPQI